MSSPTSTYLIARIYLVYTNLIGSGLARLSAGPAPPITLFWTIFSQISVHSTDPFMGLPMRV
jgi:hypothetical protein